MTREEEKPFLEQFFAKSLLPPGATTEEEAFFASLFASARQGHLCLRNKEEISPSQTAPEWVVRDGDRYYLQKNWALESHLLQRVKTLQVTSPAPLFETSLFQELLAQKVERKELLPEQARAIETAKDRSFFLLAGGPGTGKTYTAITFLHLLIASLCPGERLSLCLAAPTGKAAAHLESALRAQGALPPSVHCEATTLHRLLRLQPGDERLFSKRRIDADVIVVDEASMIDVSLLAHLLEAVGEGSRLFLMGDPHQLPPVEGTSLFAELAALFAVPLQKCLRTEEPMLKAFADAVRSGNQETTRGLLEAKDIPCMGPFAPSFEPPFLTALFEFVQPLLSWEKPDPEKSLQHIASRRVLSALRQGPHGSQELNEQLFQMTDKRAKEGQWRALPFLLTASAPHENLYNGMGGVLIGQKGGSLREAQAHFPSLPPRSARFLPPFELAFCLSIHKSQGSEFDEVVALFPPGSERFGRECFYTAVTRAKRRFRWVGETSELLQMVGRSVQCNSGFTERWQQATWDS